MFPVWINDGTTEMPTDPIFYVVAKDGIYLKKTMGDFDTMNKVDNISILGECAAYASLDIAKITTRQFTQILSLFRAVYQKFHSEANVILHYNKKRKRFRIDVPDQGVTGASVDYRNGDETYKDYIRIGTIHSHAGMSAFHSGTDQHDEENWDGLHITLGKMNSDYFDISVSLMSGGQRFMVQPQDYIEGIELVEYEEELAYKRYTYVKGVREEIAPEKKLGYRMNAPEKDFSFPKKWMEKIHRPVYKAPKYGTYMSGRNSSHAGFYQHNPSLKQSPQQKSLFDSYDVGPDDWNPCHQCPYRHHKSDLMMQDLIGSLDDETADALGFEEVEDDDKNPNSPFHVGDDKFGCDVDDPEQDGPTFGSTK